MNPAEILYNFNDGYTVNVEGDHKDIVRFYNGNLLIAEDLIRDGDYLGGLAMPFEGVIIPATANFQKYRLVSVSHGSNRDLVYHYAILGNNKVIRSFRWRDGLQYKNGTIWTDGGVVKSEIWSIANAVAPTLRGYLPFDPKALAFVCTFANGIPGQHIQYTNERPDTFTAFV